MPGMGKRAKWAPWRASWAVDDFSTPSIPPSGQGNPKARTIAPAARGQAGNFTLSLISAHYGNP